ncbi:MAG: protein tyrosine phosphatase [Desulfobulbaceae bacterium BRH_c16a]|nr:MAG: protein tyrosine phosphatase [Desulfobulbaceae bacterium BRH_c16a]
MLTNKRKKRKVLFLCTGNSCRSQMAEGLLRHLSEGRLEACSAGLAPKEHIHPLAIKVMEEIGIDISGQKPKRVGTYLGKETISFVITVCSKAEESCPRIWPGLAEANRLYWPFTDPAEAEGTEEETMTVFRQVRDQLKEKISEWLNSHKFEKR